jgi:hypothetical protein
MDMDAIKRARQDVWKTMPLSNLLRYDIARKENELNLNSQHAIKRVERIIISLETFAELASECSKYMELQIFEDGKITFMGIAVARTPDIEKWELWG